MDCEPTSIGQVYATAVRLAQRSGASEINLEILLVALDHALTTTDAIELSGEPFLAVLREHTPLSLEVQTILAAIVPFGDIFGVPTTLLRSALLAARTLREGPN